VADSVSLPLKSPLAARALGINKPHLLNLVDSGRCPPPRKDSSGHYLWTEQDLENARAALTVDRRRKAVPA
jgi:hypothetical protein